MKTHTDYSAMQICYFFSSIGKSWKHFVRYEVQRIILPNIKKIFWKLSGWLDVHFLTTKIPNCLAHLLPKFHDPV